MSVCAIHLIVRQLAKRFTVMQAVGNAGIILNVTYPGTPVMVVPSAWFRSAYTHLSVMSSQ